MAKAFVLTENHRLILRHLLREGKLSRKRLATLMHLTPAAITRLTADLIKHHYIVEKNILMKAKSVGRKEILLSLHDNLGYAMTMDWQIDEVIIAISSIQGKVLQKSALVIGNQPMMTFLGHLVQQVESMRVHLKISERKILGVGVSLGASFMHDAEELHDILQMLIPYPLLIERHALAFAEAHLLYTDGQAMEDLLLFSWSNSLSSTLVMGGKIYQGSHRQAGNIEHLPVGDQGRLCGCGRKDCLQTYLDFGVILEQIRQQFVLDNLPHLRAFLGDNPLTLTELHRYLFYIDKEATPMDPPLEALLRECAGYMARAFLVATRILDPQVILCYGTFFAHDLIYRLVVEQLLVLDPHYPVHHLQRSWLHYQRATVAGLALVVSRVLLEE
ncbi:ROK family transcriptional regulator [Entomospira culicis]|uniref:ROK family transcriptional regulator n=1 Tax=Entomospira culicis TaxID=2719989 RepID=A0A968L0A9_9SPIO|nr:ROK family transcriptional regulator [Entomospira culicis]NIZ19974.1 ROK family transcriptional regulator [Entomospira culicis]NIZ70161.1 ROK family transcriptional regulator [Entomospira culicis]WDI37994.1 ROK family transcriptional regulator [Entomospira culicis]WDI39617.1 ROK family transcriptional regulator [Entomospira culicis]